jgi:hypothetical protein
MRTVPTPKALANPDLDASAPEDALPPEDSPAPSPAGARPRAGVLGGAPGVLPDPRATPSPGHPLTTAAPPRAVAGAAARSKMHRVVTGGPVMYDGSRVEMKTGRVIAENAFDLDKLRRQGIVLEEVTG